ncbi:hypothetical protein BaRGS_00014762 [Batillaria attramentaria]|uniref:Uncharacterized protein n=1 Tax=Batillaria attramentaria TaxID=370345 RepID=A0ABD0L327_9CAEN
METDPARQPVLLGSAKQQPGVSQGARIQSCTQDEWRQCGTKGWAPACPRRTLQSSKWGDQFGQQVIFNKYRSARLGGAGMATCQASI